MAIITTYWILDIILLLFSFILILYLFYQRQFKYWSKRNVEHTENPIFLFGDLKQSNISKSIGEEIGEIYQKHKDKRFVGTWFLFRPTLLVNDPDLIKRVLVTDFYHFHDRGFYYDEENDPLSGHLFFLNGSEWKNLRAKLTPTFTSGNMKKMFTTITECGEELRQCLSKPAQHNQTVDVKDILSRFTVDVIGSCAFGIQTNTLKNPDSEFRKISTMYLAPCVQNTLRLSMPLFLPGVCKFFKIRSVKKSVTDFFVGILSETIKHREKKMEKRCDFLQLLIKMKNEGHIGDEGVSANTTDAEKFTMGRLAAQAFIFFNAGFETSSTTMQFCLYELALNLDIQRKTQEDIDRVLLEHDRKVTYEGIQDMKYLDKVVSETLRKYPAVPALIRECTKDYHIPDSKVVLEKGTSLAINMFGIHRDERYYPDPDKFDPERFTDEEKSKRPAFAYIPFGEGPRMCIGMRFGLMQTKLGLITVLSNFTVSVSEKTTIPLIIDPHSSVMSCKGRMYLKLSNRK